MEEWRKDYNTIRPHSALDRQQSVDRAHERLIGSIYPLARHHGNFGLGRSKDEGSSLRVAGSELNKQNSSLKSKVRVEQYRYFLIVYRLISYATMRRDDDMKALLPKAHSDIYGNTITNDDLRR